jgi:hypothetical protein
MLSPKTDLPSVLNIYVYELRGSEREAINRLDGITLRNKSLAEEERGKSICRKCS